MTDTRPLPGHRLAASELAALLYLAVPLLLFTATFLRPIAGVPLTALLAGVLARLALVTKRPARPSRTDLVLVAVALVWTALSGAWPLFGQPSDWLKHYAVFNALVSDKWPPALEYGTLRYALGWYLVPAGLAKLFGRETLDLLIGAWTTLGVFLALRLLVHGAPRPLLAAAVFVFFSGLDAVGFRVTGNAPFPGHLEWWSGWAQIPSHITALMWAPQHALPAWIAVGLLLSRAAPVCVAAGLPLMAAVALWSPLTAAGLAPFAAYVAWKSYPAALSWMNLAGLALLVPVALYLTAGSSGVPIVPVWRLDVSPLAFLSFNAVEWGITLAALLYASREREDLAWLAAAVLLALTVFKVGMFNDGLMRASGPAMAVLAVLSGRALASFDDRCFALGGVLILGALTGLTEFDRNTLGPRVEDSQHMTFAVAIPDSMADLRPQYFSPRPPLIRRRGPD